MRVIRALLYWLYPQQGCIDALRRKVKHQEDMIQFLKCQVKAERIENDKLWQDLNRILKTAVVEGL